MKRTPIFLLIALLAFAGFSTPLYAADNTVIGKKIDLPAKSCSFEYDDMKVVLTSEIEMNKNGDPEDPVNYIYTVKNIGKKAFIMKWQAIDANFSEEVKTNLLLLEPGKGAQFIFSASNMEPFNFKSAVKIFLAKDSEAFWVLAVDGYCYSYLP